MMPQAVVLLSASDTDLLAARASGAPWRLANPARTAPAGLPDLLDGAFCIVVRLLGGRRSWPGGLHAVLASGLPTVVLSGEPAPASAVVLLAALRAAGYDVGTGFAADGDALIGQLIAAGGYDTDG